MDEKMAQEMYIKGHNISDIARTCGVTRQTIYKKKARDKAAGIDWDALALAKNRNQTNVIKSEESFILTLIESFEMAFNEIKELKPDAKLEILKEYADTYYKLKAPLKTDTKAQILDAITNTINEIADLASRAKNDYVTDFLANNADEILKRVLKK